MASSTDTVTLRNGHVENAVRDVRTERPSHTTWGRAVWIPMKRPEPGAGGMRSTTWLVGSWVLVVRSAW